MNDNRKYTPVEDGWRNGVKPSYVSVEEDHFNENSINVELTFILGEGCEMPKAKIPLIYASDHKIVKYVEGRKTEHVATMQDQRDAYSLLISLFPAWEDFCKGEHTTEEKIRWFESEGIDVVRGTSMDIKVWHSTSGFANATVKDPRNAKPKREKITKAAALQRFSDTFGSMFGKCTVVSGTTEADDNEVPF